jgi:hypothetical protein
MSNVRGLRPGQIQNYEYVVAAQNLLVNPGFEIWQRGAGAFTTHTLMTADEWQLYYGSGTWSVSRNSSPYSGVYCLSVTSSGTVSGYIMQGIENGISLMGSYLTFSCWVKCSVPSAIQLAIADWTGSIDSTLSSFHTGSGNWERLTVVKQIRTGLVPNTTSWPHAFPVLAMVLCYKPVTAALLDGAVCVVGNYPEGVPFIPLMPAEDLRRCQRFFEVHGGALATHPIFVAYSAAGNSFVLSQQFKEQKYAIPTCTVSGNWTLVNCTTLATIYISQHGYALYASTTANAYTAWYPADSTGIVSIAVP